MNLRAVGGRYKSHESRSIASSQSRDKSYRPFGLSVNPKLPIGVQFCLIGA